jgi:hypothetical protein
MRHLAALTIAAVLTACGQADNAEPPSTELAAAPVEGPAAPSPSEVVQAFYGDPDALRSVEARARYLAADVAAALDDSSEFHDFRRNLTMASYPLPPGDRDFTLVETSSDAPTVLVTGVGLGHAMAFTLCRTAAGEWRIAEVEELGHWQLRDSLDMSAAVTCG